MPLSISSKKKDTIGEGVTKEGTLQREAYVLSDFLMSVSNSSSRHLLTFNNVRGPRLGFWGTNMNWDTLVGQLYNGVISTIVSIKEISTNCCKSLEE